jgi:hypothetical protein
MSNLLEFKIELNTRTNTIEIKKNAFKTAVMRYHVSVPPFISEKIHLPK